MKDTKLAIKPYRKKTQLYTDAVEKLNSDILKVTLRIQDKHPELSKYIEEMSITIPNDNHPDISLNKLKKYYNSLNEMLDSYVLEQSQQQKNTE